MAKAYGSITLVDIGDLGQLSVVPESNQPTMIIYDPDSGVYNPDWSVSNLRLTPVVYYGGKQIQLSNSNLKISWESKVGSGDASSITSGVSNGVLTVNSNPFNNISLLTYIVTAEYTEANMGTTLTASGQITFGLIQNASKVKTITLTGESAFLYKSGTQTPIKDKIILTAIAKNTTIAKWQYLTYDEETKTEIFVDIPNTNNTLTVASDSFYFVDDIAVIRVLAADDDLYDEHTIVKIRDGANGTSTVSVVLSNDDQMVAADSAGNVTSSLDDVTTTITIYSGNTDITDKYNIQANAATGITGALTGNVYKVSGITNAFETGSVTFTCTPKTDSGYTETFIKKFTITKIKTGADGITPTIYSLVVDSLAVNKTTAGIYTPSVINISAFSQTGNDKNSYKGRFKIYEDGVLVYPTSGGSDESTHQHTIGTGVSEKIVVELYNAGTAATLYDTQTIVITSDGAKGDTGESGEDGEAALNFVMGNYSDVIPCTNAGAVAQATNILIPFTAYKGVDRVACSASYSTLPSGMTLSSNTAGTVGADGQLYFVVAKGATLGDADSGTIIITLTAEGKTSNQTYRWTKNKQAKDGASAVLFQIWAPEGDVISNNENDVTLETRLVDGATNVTASSYQWYEFTNGAYNSISDATNSNYTVRKDSVDSYKSFKCVATYQNNSYEAYFSVKDQTDPLQINVYSSLGDKILNSQGKGIVYALVYRNGEEIDPIKTLNCGETAPTSPTLGDYFWLLNSTNQTATLMRYNGSSWATPDTSQDQTGRYNWTFRNSDNVVDGNATGKAIYVDATVINKKKTFDVEVIV